MPAPETVASTPTVSVIVPARNEEACLAACLESLVAQTGVSFEIIVVDDASTDRSREIAQSFPAVQIVDAGPPPPNWTGKTNAMAAGASVARGEWLLFTDADTVHKSGALAGAVAGARQHGAALLSYSPEQDVRGLWEKAVMPVIFAELAATYQPSLVNDPRSAAAAANGQYILIAREAYDAIGGYTAVSGTLLEDVALAKAVKASGRGIRFRFGGDAVRTRMYRSFDQLREGWTKNLALLFRSPVRLALLRLTEFVLIAGGSAAAVAAALRGHAGSAITAAILAVTLYGFLLSRIRQAHFSWQATALSPLGLPLFAYLLLRSKLSHAQGTVLWKGRTYGSGTSHSGEDGVIIKEQRPAGHISA
jgi:cellulose synthase/poly-beta-1,6-N-acetylglucosamine synthase-like glycosyltransferase